MKLSFSVCALCSLFFLEFLLAANDSECTFWNQLSQNLSHASEQNGGAVRLACSSACTSINCTGHFNAPTLMNVGYDFDFRFGLRLNHCDKPVTMDYYLEAPDINISKSGSISHNDSLDLPGPKMKGAQTTIVILVEMVRINASYILFGINGNLRISFGGMASFPIKERVFPPTYIDIPPCQKPMTKMPFIAPVTWKGPPTTAKTAPSSTKKAGSTQKPSSSRTFNNPCEIGITTQCGQYEICKVRDDMSDKRRSGTCICEPESVFDTKTGSCAPNSPTTATAKPTGSPSVTIAQKKTEKTKHAGVNTTAKPTGSPSVTIAQKKTEKTKHAGVNTGSTQKPPSSSRTFNNPCEIGITTQCGQYEMCKVRDDMNDKKRSGTCICEPESVFDTKTGSCAPTSPTTRKSTAKPTGSPSVTIAQKKTEKTKHAGVNMTAVIIGAVFGGLLLIVVVVSIIIFLGRRRRHANYPGQHQLLSDNDIDDDTNVVI